MSDDYLKGLSDECLLVKCDVNPNTITIIDQATGHTIRGVISCAVDADTNGPDEQGWVVATIRVYAKTDIRCLAGVVTQEKPQFYDAEHSTGK